MNWSTRYANDEKQKDHYKYIKRQGDKWVVIQKGTGKVLSHHDSREKAIASFRAMMMNKHASFDNRPVALTSRAHERLTKELKDLGPRLDDARRQKEQAAALGDRSESGDYDAASRQLKELEGRSRHIQSILDNHVIIESNQPIDYARPGHRVSVRHSDGEMGHYWLTSLENYSNDLADEDETDYHTRDTLANLNAEHKDLSRAHRTLSDQREKLNRQIEDHKALKDTYGDPKKWQTQFDQYDEELRGTIDQQNEVESRMNKIDEVLSRSKPLDLVTPRSSFSQALLNRSVGERIHWYNKQGDPMTAEITSIGNRYE